MNANQRFDNDLQQKLDKRNADGLLRTLVYNDGKTDFSSNDYLGFSRLQQLHINDNELSSGSTGSRLVTGNSVLAEETEKKIAQFHQSEAALIFNSGYMANVGLFSCIASKDDVIISDEYIHASIIDGIRLSLAKRLKFAHNDLADLEKKLQLPASRRFVAVESIYSMDGDEAPLKQIVTLCNKYDALLIVDEAHAIGIFGDKGEGLVCKYGLQKDVYATVYTFGKALGLHGAAVTGSNVLRNYLINHARSFIYTTALPPHTYIQIQKAYHLLVSADREILYDLIEHFTNSAARVRSVQFVQSKSAIQGIIIGGNLKAKALAAYLQSKGFFVKAILSPTVPAGTERLRICLHSFNTKEEIDALLNEVNIFTA